ncbi:S1 RNA-binding domain-containing protein [Haloferula sp.]|uniref:CvfB family protein n=1 Tax=Haloferula sp. TaxID=2497595 RepID=UPI00329C11D0
MARIGERVALTVLREASPGVFLDGGEELGEVLLPKRELPPIWEVGGLVRVFLYTDSEDRPIATCQRPKVMPGEFAYLECVAVSGVGAFVNWGLQKDLLVPFREQKDPMEVGKSYVVHVHVDPESDRVVASRRLNRYLSQEPPRYTEGEEVELILFGKTDLGYKAIINGQHSGVLFANEVHRRLRAGEQTKGYIVQVRSDGKIDLSLYAPGRARIDDLETQIEDELIKRGGSWELCDSSSPEQINKALGVSKKAFKQATGALYRRKRITISKDGIKLIGFEPEEWRPE